MSQSWMKSYYLDPQPEQFVAEVKKLAAEGTLGAEQHSLVMGTFLGRILAANPGRLAAWLTELGDLAPDELRTLHMAAWFSDTAEGRAFLAGKLADPLFAQRPPDLLASRPVEDAQTLDVLWAYYFATGEPRAVRRIVSALAYMSYFGDAKRFRETAQTPEDQARALRDAIFQAASWSLESLMKEQPPLKHLCESLVREGKLPASEYCALAIILSKVDPESWRVQIDPVTNQAQVSWRNEEPPAQHVAPPVKSTKPWWKFW